MLIFNVDNIGFPYFICFISSFLGNFRGPGTDFSSHIRYYFDKIMSINSRFHWLCSQGQQNKLKTITWQAKWNLISKKHGLFYYSSCQRSSWTQQSATCRQTFTHSAEINTVDVNPTLVRILGDGQTNAVGPPLPPLLNLISGWLKKQSSYSDPPPPGQQNLLLSPGPAAFCPAENSITIGLCVHSVGGIFPLHCEVHSTAELGPWGF